MTLDSSVMNVSIRRVAADVGTTMTGIQTAITLYTLVMASLMITGGRLAGPRIRQVAIITAENWLAWVGPSALSALAGDRSG